MNASEAVFFFLAGALILGICEYFISIFFHSHEKASGVKAEERFHQSPAVSQVHWKSGGILRLRPVLLAVALCLVGAATFFIGRSTRDAQAKASEARAAINATEFLSTRYADALLTTALTSLNDIRNGIEKTKPKPHDEFKQLAYFSIRWVDPDTIYQRTTMTLEPVRSMARTSYATYPAGSPDPHKLPRREDIHVSAYFINSRGEEHLEVPRFTYDVESISEGPGVPPTYWLRLTLHFPRPIRDRVRVVLEFSRPRPDDIVEKCVFIPREEGLLREYRVIIGARDTLALARVLAFDEVKKTFVPVADSRAQLVPYPLGRGPKDGQQRRWRDVSGRDHDYHLYELRWTETKVPVAILWQEASRLMADARL